MIFVVGINGGRWRRSGGICRDIIIIIIIIIINIIIIIHFDLGGLKMKGCVWEKEWVFVVEEGEGDNDDDEGEILCYDLENIMGGLRGRW